MLLMVAATVFVIILHAAIRHVSARIPAPETAFFRAFFALVLLSPWFLRVGLAPLKTKRIGLHALRGLANVSAMITLHKGLGMAGLAVVNAVYFTSPLFASLGAIVLLRERVRSRRIAALIIGFVGTLIIIRPGFEGFSPGALWVVVAAMFWAWVVILTRILGRTESSVTIVAYMTLFLTPMALGPALTVWVTPTTTEFGWLALVGACQIGTQMCHAQALKLAEATAVMPLDFGRLIWASLLGYLLFAEVPDVWTWIGGTVIFASSIHIAYREAWNREAGAARPTGRGDKD